MINSFCFQTKGKPATGENIKAYRSNTEDTETQNGFINSSTKKKFYLVKGRGAGSVMGFIFLLCWFEGYEVMSMYHCSLCIHNFLETFFEKFLVIIF